MLINITNHPSDKWTEIQILAALKYGTVRDLPFPPVNPDFDTDDIMQEALHISRKIISIIRNDNEVVSAVHVMGEMTFCFALISLLQKEGITCLASTTDRIASENGNTKLVEFKFVRFRDYPLVP